MKIRVKLKTPILNASGLSGIIDATIAKRKSIRIANEINRFILLAVK